MKVPFEQELRCEDGAYFGRVASGELLAVLASGPVLSGMHSTATFVARVFADETPEGPEHALTTLHRAASEHRLVSATAALWRRGGLVIAWVGDVRAHLIRGVRLVASTHDHTLAHELPRADLLPIGGPSGDVPGLERIVIRTLGGAGNLDLRTWATSPGDALLMCAAHVHDFRPPAAYLDLARDFTRPLPGRVLIRGYQESMSSRSSALGSKVSPTESI